MVRVPAPPPQAVAAAMAGADNRNPENIRKGFYGNIRAGLRPGVPGGWASDHYEETLHFTGWNYVAGHAVALQCAGCEVEVTRPAGVVDSWTGKARRQWSLMKMYRNNVRQKFLKSHGQDEDERDVLPDGHRLVNLIKHPNEFQSGAHVRYEVSVQLSLTGTAFIVKIPNKFGLPRELYSIPTCLMTPRPPSSQYPRGAYNVSPAATRTNWADDSFVSMVGYQRLAGMTIPMEDVVRISFPHPLWKDEGYSPLAAAALWIDTGEQIDRSRWSWMRNGADPSVLLIPPENVNPTESEIARVLAQWDATKAGSANHGRAIVAPGGMKVEKLSLSPEELKYVDAFTQFRDAELAVHGVPGVAAGITDGGSYAAFYASLKQFSVLTIQPRLDWFAEALTTQLAPLFGDNLMVEMFAQAIDDPSVLEAELATDLTARSITKNEIRNIRGLPPRPDGDVWAGETATVRTNIGETGQAGVGLEQEALGEGTGKADATQPPMPTATAGGMATATAARLPGATPAPVTPVQGKPTEQTAGLEAGKINAAIAVVTKVAAGEMPRDAGVAMLEGLFGFSNAAAEKLMGSAGTGKPTEPNAPKGGGGPPPVPGANGNGNGKPLPVGITPPVSKALRWVTLENGVHVQIDGDSGAIHSGPEGLRGRYLGHDGKVSEGKPEKPPHKPITPPTEGKFDTAGDPFIDPKKVFGHSVADLPRISDRQRRELENGGGTRAEVDLDSLTPTQDYTHDGKVRSLAQNFDPKKAVVQVVRQGGRNYIFDGHHTAAAAIMHGEGKIQANVIDVKSFNNRMAYRKALGPVRKPYANYGPYTVYLVDPTEVRGLSLADEEFTDYAVHADFPLLIPEDDIWVGANVDQDERPFMIAAALCECRCLAEGMTRDAAYDRSMVLDRRLREEARLADGGSGLDKVVLPEELYVRHLGDTGV